MRDLKTGLAFACYDLQWGEPDPDAGPGVCPKGPLSSSGAPYRTGDELHLRPAACRCDTRPHWNSAVRSGEDLETAPAANAPTRRIFAIAMPPQYSGAAYNGVSAAAGPSDRGLARTQGRRPLLMMLPEHGTVCFDLNPLGC